MVAYNFKHKMRAELLAKGKRHAGYKATVFKKKKGYGVSVTRK